MSELAAPIHQNRAGPVPANQLQPFASPRSKYVYRARERILAQRAPHIGDKPVMLAADRSLSRYAHFLTIPRHIRVPLRCLQIACTNASAFSARERRAHAPSAQEWSGILARFKRGGQSHREFCEREGLAGSKVEGMVVFARRTFMVPFPRVRDFADLNVMLETRCRERQGKTLRGYEAAIGVRGLPPIRGPALKLEFGAG